MRPCSPIDLADPSRNIVTICVSLYERCVKTGGGNRMNRWRIAGLVLLILVLAGGAAVAFRGRIATAAMARLYAHALGDAPYAGLGDGLHVGLCGSGSPMPDPTRAGPCTVVLAGRRLFVVDVGAGAQKNLALMNLPPPRIEAIFLTHNQSDHINGQGKLILQRWAGGARTAPVPV